ncbi:hypothetical protein Tco_1547801 [Tanacetum coccineum]
MMYGRPLTNPFQNPPRNTTSPFQNYMLMLEQHQDEYFDDVWTPKQAMEAIENYTPSKIISKQELVNLRAQAERLFGDEKVRVELPRSMSWLDYDEFIGDLGMMEDKVDNPSPQSTPQVFPSFEVYTPHVTYPEEVEETIGIPMEVEPLNQTQLEDLGLSTCSHDLFPSSREFPSVDEPEPQPLPNLPFLDINLGDKRGPEPLIKPHNPGSFRVKEIFNENSAHGTPKPT